MVLLQLWTAGVVSCCGDPANAVCRHKHRTFFGNTTFLKSGGACSCVQLVANIFGQIRLLLALYERLQADVEESRT